MSYEVTVTGNNAVSVDVSGVSTISVDVSQVGQQGVKGVNYITGGWVVSTAYAISDVLVNNGTSYICILAHTSASTDEPGVGVNTATYWEVFSASGAAGADGTGFTGGSYDAGTGVVTFTSDDGLGFVTGDLRGADGTGTVNSVDITGGTGITSTGGPITSTGAITVDLDAATQTSLGLADTSLQPSDIGVLPTIRPSLNLDFANTNYLDSRITFSRSTTATYYDQFGTLQTAAIGEARFDHDPATGEAKGLLIEEQRTNLLTYSEQFDNAAWFKANATVTANATTAPDGTTTADKLVEDTTASSNHTAFQSTTYSAGDYTLSVYLKASGRTFARLVGFDGTSVFSCYVNLSTGEITGASGVSNSTSDDVGGGWYRTSISFSASAGSGNIAIRMATGGTGSDDTYTGDGTSGIFLWGAQLEAGSFSTSYIKTEAATATRVADDVSMTGTNFSDWYNQSAGTFVGDLDSLGGTGVPVLFSIGTTFDDVTYASISGSNLVLTVRSGGTSFYTGPAIALPSDQFKFAVALKDDDMALAVDGGTLSTDTSGTIPSPTNLTLGRASWSAGNYSNIHIKRLSYYPRRLTDAELVALTEV